MTRKEHPKERSELGAGGWRPYRHVAGTEHDHPKPSRPLLFPPPRIIDRRAAARGFIYLRSLVAACDTAPEVFDLRLCGADTLVRLLGLARPLGGGAGR